MKGELFIWDNSPISHHVPEKNAIWEKINYYHSPENKGLSIAYNYAAKLAYKRKYKWICLLDQDTTFSPDLISTLNDAIKQNSDIQLFAPIIKLKNNSPFSPFIYKHKQGHPTEVTSGRHSLFDLIPVNSGMVININSFLKSKGYNEQIKLDFSDIQFIENFRKLYPEFYVCDTIAYQNFSNEEKDVTKLKKRFEIYCECAKYCSKKNIFDRIEYFFIVIKHMIGLIIKTKEFSFISIFIRCISP